MKTLRFLAIAAGFLLFGCGGDPVQKDLINYVNVELPKVAQLESEAITAYRAVEGDNYTSDSLVYATLTETVIPKYEAFSSVLESIKPATTDIMAMHEEYIKAAGEQMEAFKLITIAIKNQDATVITKANEDLKKAQGVLTQWRADLTEQCKKHKVELKD